MHRNPSGTMVLVRTISRPSADANWHACRRS